MFTLIPSHLLYSPLYSYQVNYQFQSDLYNKADEMTEEVQWLRLPVFFINNISTFATFITRIAGIAESFFKGCGMLLSSPFSSTPLEHAKKGLEKVIIHTSKNILRLACLPVQFFFDSLALFIEPKVFVIDKAEYLRVDLKHAIAKTLGSEEHKKDLMPVSGIAYNKYRAYQRRTFERLEKN